MSEIRFLGLAGLSLCAAAAAISCGSSDSGTPVPAGSGGSGGDASLAGDSSLEAESSAGSGGSILLEAGLEGSGKYGCSGDLRAVVDGNGKTVKTCPADQGCSQGECIEACAAAAASHGNVGCDYWLTTPATYPPTLPPCFAAFVTNTWARSAKLTVSLGVETFDVTKFGRLPKNGAAESTWDSVPPEGIPKDDVAVLFLSQDPTSVFLETGKPVTCPVTPALNKSTVLPKTGIGQAFHIVSDTPIGVYDIIPYGGAESHFPSAQLVFPVSAWGTNYVVLATPPGTHSSPGPLWGHILAAEDSTEIKVLPSVDLPAGYKYPAAPKGQTATFTIDTGQYLQWELAEGSQDLSGTVVLANKPVAVFAGNRFFRLQPVAGPGGESTHQQNQPVPSLGHEYVVAPYETRRADLQPETIHYRLVGAVEGTVLTSNPAGIGPATLAQGQIADFTSSAAFSLSSQDAEHPFSLAQIMDTANLDGGTRPGATAPGYPPMLGDEEFVILLPPAQFLTHYVFFTDPAYPTSNLVLTRVKGANGFQDVTIDCLGTIEGWKPVGTSGLYEVTTVDLIRADLGVKGCTNGRHVADSTAPFGIVVWGLDCYSSYAYPAGGNAAQLSSVVVQPSPK